MKTKFRSTRWILLAAGIIAVVVITSMNVYSLFSLHNNSIKNARQAKKIQLSEFAEKVKHRFFAPFRKSKLASLDMVKLDSTFRQNHQMPRKAQHILYRVSKDSLFKNTYLIPDGISSCKSDGKLLQFQPRSRRFEPTAKPVAAVCEAMEVARGRMRSLIHNYKYNNKVFLDTPRTMVIALVNQKNQTVAAYLALPVNQSYMIHRFLEPSLRESFGPKTDSELNVWLRNWTSGRVLASSNPPLQFDPHTIEFRQQFPHFFDDWRLYASIKEGAVLGNSGPALWLNLLLLAAALVFLVGAMLFLFFTARREEALARRQSDFLANVTHELKTPISVMQAAGENLADGRINDKERLKSYGTHIYSESVRLQQMIDRLLDVARADAGQSFTNPKPVDLKPKIEQFIQKLYPHIEKRGFVLDLSLEDNLSQIMIDEQDLETILRNLVNNAMKYSGQDKFLGIYLSGTREEVSLKVVDHGKGMSKSVKKRIFEKFYRAEDALTAKTNGYGLGLSIVEDLVDRNNGTINVTSKIGKGSTFNILFPVAETGPTPKNSRSPSVKQKASKIT